MFHFSIYSIDKEIFDGQIESATLPGLDGELGVLTNHIPYITPLKQGTIKIKGNGKDQNLPIESGILEVKPGKAIVLVNF